MINPDYDRYQIWFTDAYGGRYGSQGVAKKAAMTAMDAQKKMEHRENPNHSRSSLQSAKPAR